MYRERESAASSLESDKVYIIVAWEDPIVCGELNGWHDWYSLYAITYIIMGINILLFGGGNRVQIL